MVNGMCTKLLYLFAHVTILGACPGVEMPFTGNMGKVNNLM